MLRLVLPKGSLEQATLQLFEDADLTVSRGSDVDYRGTIDDPRVADVRILRPQEIPQYVAEGLFDVGVTGRDWIEERSADVVTLTELHYSKATARPIQMVLAVAADSPAAGRDGSPGRARRAHRVPRAHPPLLREARRRRRRRSSATARPRPRCPRSPTRSSRSPRPGARCAPPVSRCIDTILVSYTELIANPVAYADPTKRQAMEQLQTLLTGALEARGRVLVKLNVDGPNLDAVIALLPALKSPTVSKLFGDDALRGRDRRRQARDQHLDPRAQGHGATGIIELPIAKIVH